jgi:hypothetical protein
VIGISDYSVVQQRSFSQLVSVPLRLNDRLALGVSTANNLGDFEVIENRYFPQVFIQENGISRGHIMSGSSWLPLLKESISPPHILHQMMLLLIVSEKKAPNTAYARDRSTRPTFDKHRQHF